MMRYLGGGIGHRLYHLLRQPNALNKRTSNPSQYQPPTASLLSQTELTHEITQLSTKALGKRRQTVLDDSDNEHVNASTNYVQVGTSKRALEKRKQAGIVLGNLETQGMVESI